MEAVLLIGIQASGKSTFYKERFFSTHLRLNLDMLKTRHRLHILMRACIDAQQRFVVDNTNLSVAERALIIEAAQTARFQITGYFFVPEPNRALTWNAARSDNERVPNVAIWDSMKRLEVPTLTEGFNALFNIRVVENGDFQMTDMQT